jgi:predicted enzyme related to lactoylglutathione lyase
MIKAVSMIILMEPDLDKAVAFYQEIGGLRLMFRMRDKWAEFDAQGVKIGLCPTAQPVIDRRTGVVLEVADVHDLYTRFKDSGVFLGDPVEKVHGIMISMRDPGGNIIDLYQPTPERLKAFVEQVKAQEKEQAQAGCCGSRPVQQCSTPKRENDSCAGSC